MNAFNTRANKSKELCNYLIDYLKSTNISYFESGYEYYKQYNNALKILKYNDNTSKFVRYYPDFTIVLKDVSALIEVKNSSGIEKECYDNYLFLAKTLNLNIYLFCFNKKLCKLTDIVFKKIDSFDKTAKMNVPITNEVWKEPRKMSAIDYQEYLKAYNFRTSGCSFAYIDFQRTKFYEINVLNKFN
jgi:hypothetical protein